jgi:hypothetical protein
MCKKRFKLISEKPPVLRSGLSGTTLNSCISAHYKYFQRKFEPWSTKYKEIDLKRRLGT